MRWLPAAGLTLALLLTFAPWDGMYPAGYPAYTQNAWDALFAGLGRDDVAEDELNFEQNLRPKLRSSWWLLPYFLALPPALVLAWLGPLAGRPGVKLPAFLNPVLRYRPALLAGLTGLTLLLLVLQWGTGFGVDRAARAMAAENFAKDMKDANTPEKQQRVEMRVAAGVGACNLRTTFWLRLAALAHLAALAGVAGEALLQGRGDRPPPRVGIVW